MGIKIKHGEPATLLTAAQIAGQERAARQQLEITERMQAQQREFEYRTAIRQQDMALDLQMQERAKLWEIDKMELRSRLDFQREEQMRQRKMDSLDSAIQQIDKEVLAGRITEQEAYPIKQKLELSKVGVSVPVSAFPGDEEDRTGVAPWWTAEKWKETPEGIAARERAISGERRGVVPYYLDPTFIGNYPEAARQAQEARGIFLSDEEFNALTERREMPLGDKRLDVGVRTEAEVRPLDSATARQILTEAGGDRDRARQIARQRGYSF